MPDLVFTTRGQAEALAAQEEVARRARQVKEEIDGAARAVGAWDSETAKLKRTAESALRSISTEQEKIASKIASLEEAQKRGLIPPEEAHRGITRLRQEWVNVDGATKAAIQANKELQSEQLRTKSAAESALKSVQTEQERILEQIEEIEQAQRDGLIPPDEAEQGLIRLRHRLEEIGDGPNSSAGRVGESFRKAFDPMVLTKFALGFVGIKAMIGQIQKELQALQDQEDKRVATQLTAAQSEARLIRSMAEFKTPIGRDRMRSTIAATGGLATGAGVDRTAIQAAVGDLIGRGVNPEMALHLVEQQAQFYADDPSKIADAAYRSLEESGLGRSAQSFGRFMSNPFQGMGGFGIGGGSVTEAQKRLDNFNRQQAQQQIRNERALADAQEALTRAETRTARTPAARAARGQAVSDAELRLSRVLEDQQMARDEADRQRSALEADLNLARTARDGRRGSRGITGGLADRFGRAFADIAGRAFMPQGPDAGLMDVSGLAPRARINREIMRARDDLLLGDGGQFMSSDELEAIATMMRESGLNNLEQQFQRFTSRFPDGRVDIGETRQWLRSRGQHLTREGRQVTTYAVPTGHAGPTTPITRWDAPSEREQEVGRVFLRLDQSMGRNEKQMDDQTRVLGMIEKNTRELGLSGGSD